MIFFPCEPFFFPSPEPKRAKHAIFPVFIPFSGCPVRCVFCAQEVQTGRVQTGVEQALVSAGERLESMTPERHGTKDGKKPSQIDDKPTFSGICKGTPTPAFNGGNECRLRLHGGALPKTTLSTISNGKPLGSKYTEAGAGRQAQCDMSRNFLELAFYGGTFTALERRDFLACLRFGAYWRDRGVIRAMRCSTRPDAVTPAILSELKDAGFTCVELGIQSFSEGALAVSRRGYSAEQARRGCAMVKESGLMLGVQLLPGMPGHAREDADGDIRETIGLSPDFVRLYPCLVLDGTALAAMWRRGEYTPWDLEETVDFLAEACHAFRRENIPIIRMGLAEEPGLADHVLAGPRHPAIGGMARSRALFIYIREQTEQLLRKLGISAPLHFRLSVPRRFQGEFWGHSGELATRYASLGITGKNISWWNEEHFCLEVAE